jgi:hypothetical protein
MTLAELDQIGKHTRYLFRGRWMTEDAIQCWLRYEKQVLHRIGRHKQVP